MDEWPTWVRCQGDELGRKGSSFPHPPRTLGNSSLNHPCPGASHWWNQELKPVWVGDFVFNLWVPPAKIAREPDPRFWIVFVPQDLH